MKQKIGSRLCSLLLLVVFLFSLTAPAFAEEGEGATATDFTVSLSDLTLTLKESGTLTPTITPAPAEGAEVKYEWSTVGGESATLPFKALTAEQQKASSIKLEAESVGSAAINLKVTVNGVSHYASCTVTVQYAATQSISVLPASAGVLEVGKTKELTAYLTPADTADPGSVKWSVDNGEVVRLSTTSGEQVTLTAVSPGKATVTATSGTKSVTCAVTVRGMVLSDTAATIIVGKTMTLTAQLFETDSSIVTWTSNNESVALVNETTGVVTGVGVGTAGITATSGSYSVTCYVTVEENTAATIPSDIEAGGMLDLGELRGELNEVCQEILGSGLAYLTNLSVSTDAGTLYYGYLSESSTGLGVGVSERYYYNANATQGQRSLNDVSFIPKAGFTGTATLSYTAYSTTGATFSGEIALTVQSVFGVSYSTPTDTPVTLSAADFAEVCRVQTGGTLSYVTFQLPSSARGTLYYKYDPAALYSEPVSASKQYRTSGTLLLSNVTFVPAEHYSGTVTIKYTAVNTAGASYTDTLTIEVTGDTQSWDEIVYQLDENGTATFKAADFNAACTAAGGTTLSYVRFVLPDSAIGTLYYDGSTSSRYDGEVSYDTRYYYKSTPAISDVNFVANGTLREAVYLDFVAYDTAGQRFYCKLCIEPSDKVTTASTTVSYSAVSGHYVTFSPEDFNEVSLECTGSPLSYVKFELPSSSRGVLYSNYSSTSPSKVSESTSYYRSGSLGKVAFVPNTSYTGTVSIPYTGRSTSGSTFEGVIRITVTKGTDLTIVRTTTSGGAVWMNETDFNAVCYSLTGETLNYVRFTLPDSKEGVLYYGYNKSTGTYSGKVNASTSYYYTAKSTRRTIDNVVFLADSAYTGTVELSFTGWSSSTSTKITGTLRIVVSEPTAEVVIYRGNSLPFTLDAERLNTACVELLGRELDHIRFTSLPDHTFGQLYLNYESPANTGTAVSIGTSYYADDTPALDALTFVPAAGYEGTLTLYYVGKDSAGIGFSGAISLVISNDGISSRFSDMEGERAEVLAAVEFLSDYDVITGTPAGAFRPNGNLSRGDFALMICRAFGLNTGSTVSFSDVPEDSYYAWAIATLKDLKVVQGDGILFCPKNPLSKQDAITMLYRVINVVGLDLNTASTYLLSYYADGDAVSSYAQQAVATLLAAGIATADEQNQIAPRQPIRRAELAVMLHRLLTY